ncbi:MULTISPECIES: TIGR01459 family HAD-type hydrolase [Oceanicaulis]|uniref:TIGR01459 family HAD-type hydrolase n=1 Tax=Oceanicaulis TaxID=153232 RepID=UPI000ED6DE2F|nr:MULTISPECIES: TIGR01459 family HAD-type hydrolase [Oceanicaulis]HCR66921.1 TIGR01459 family HAD-type hydrolase [Oceanicaulis sp.]|tara:strand:+ start:3009 stop:3857 length:849 start_codon:yes stop_codon:yes gene_type:complete
MTDFPRLSDLARDYDAILCDVWGVIRDGSDLLPEALDALRRYRAQGGTVVLVSNSPRRASSLENFLKQMGSGEDVWDGAVSSGEATHALLETRAPGPAFKLGPNWDDALYEGTGLEFAKLEDAAFISCTGLFDWENETPDDYTDLLTEAKLRRLDLICANPDIVVQFGDGLRYCAGALAQKYQEMGGTAVMAGKPHPPIYDLAYREIERLRGERLDKARVLAVGDGPHTDIQGAQSEGVDALFIADGILGQAFDQGFDANKAAALLAEDGLVARYCAPKLVW